MSSTSLLFRRLEEKQGSPTFLRSILVFKHIFSPDTTALKLTSKRVYEANDMVLRKDLSVRYAKVYVSLVGITNFTKT
jgi:hypothetical protein